MTNLIIAIEEKTFTATKPKVKHLKEFLKFQKEYNAEKGFNSNALDSLSNILKAVFKDLTDEELEGMEVSQFMSIFNDMANWMAESMGGEEKN